MRLVIAPLAAALLLCFSGVSEARALQSSESGFTLNQATVLPSPDLAKLNMEDSKRVGGPYRYGVQIPLSETHLGNKSFGRWSKAGNGQLKWHWDVLSPAARTLDFHFSTLQLPPSAKLYIRGEGEGNERLIDASQLTGSGFWSPYIAGEKARIELRVDAAEKALVKLELASVTHGYRGLFDSADSLSKSGSCNVDTICPAGDAWRDQIDAVGHYTFSQGSSSYVCTGTLLANTANTTTPYFLTANHCMSTQTVANTIVVYWNYQSSTCRTPGSTSSGTPLSKSIASHSQSGATLRATNSASDFTLLELSAAVPSGANPYFSGWDRSGTTPSSAVGIHHPQGHEKRIAVENQALSTTAYGGGSGTTHWRVMDWDQGTTEGGSSGSGLWNQNKLLVGQLHGGSAACGNDLSDYYGKLSVSWTGGGSSSSRLSNWLDASGTGANSIAGYRTGGTPPPPPPPPSNQLSNGVPVTGLSATSGNALNYTMAVPAGASNLSFVMSGGSGDADLYVKFGSAPTTTSYDCRPYLSGNSETCNFATPQTGTYYVMVRAYSTFSGVSLTGSYSAGGGGQPSFFENTTDYTINDNSTVESPITVSGRTGNAPSNLKVNVTIYHTYKGDLKVDLVAPDGSLYNIHNRSGGSADNIIGTFTVNASSEVANGTWKLRVNDNANGDVGRIDKWSLQF